METNNNNNTSEFDVWDDNEAFLKAASFEELENPQAKNDSDNDQNDKKDDNDESKIDSEEKADDLFSDLEDDASEEESKETSEEESEDENDDEVNPIEKIFETTGIDKDIFQHVDFEKVSEEEDVDINSLIFDETQGRFEKYVENMASSFDDTAIKICFRNPVFCYR